MSTTSATAPNCGTGGSDRQGPRPRMAHRYLPPNSRRSNHSQTREKDMVHFWSTCICAPMPAWTTVVNSYAVRKPPLLCCVGVRINGRRSVPPYAAGVCGTRETTQGHAVEEEAEETGWDPDDQELLLESGRCGGGARAKRAAGSPLSSGCRSCCEAGCSPGWGPESCACVGR